MNDRFNCMLVSHSFTLNDPPVRQAAETLASQGYEVHFVHAVSDHEIATDARHSLTVHEIHPPQRFKRIRPLYSWLRWRRFKSEIHRKLAEIKPQLVVVKMLHPLAALPMKNQPHRYKLVSFIPDIPAIRDAGKLDRRIIKRGWKRLKKADIVWASDIYKAHLAQKLGKLPSRPLVCHNCPPLDYLPNPVWPRDPWLRSELRKQGVSIEIEGGCILLRAGAIGECGGIEETLSTMLTLPEDFIFLMIGRPSKDYADHLKRMIVDLGLQRRALFWDRPNDEIWKMALQGADIGHLIHGPFPPGSMTQAYELNSSLSNNRLFQYMAAGLPIIAYDDPRMNDLCAEVDCFKIARLENLKTDLHDIINNLGSHPDVRRALGMTAREAHLQKYNWEIQFAPVLAICAK